MYLTIPNNSNEKFPNIPAFNLSDIADRYTMNIKFFASFAGLLYHLQSYTPNTILVL